MKTLTLSLIAGAAIALTVSCGQSPSHSGHHHEFEEEDEHEHEHNTNSSEISFSPEKAKQFGVEVSKVSYSTMHSTIKTSGKIEAAQGEQYIVVAPSAGTVRLRQSIIAGAKIGSGATVATISAKHITGGDANEQAHIALRKAKREIERLKPLYQDKIVTASQYNEALQAYESAKAACASSAESSSTAATAISGTVTALLVTDGQYVEAGAPIAQVSKNANLVLTASLPTSAAAELNNITDANFRTSNSAVTTTISALGGHRIFSDTYASTTTPGYLNVNFQFKNNGDYVSGAYAEVYLIGQAKQKAITVPKSAITEELGTFYVYIQLDEDCYMKRPVTTGISDGLNVEITSGLSEGESVVTKGATVIKLAATSGSIPGHTHEH